MRLLLNILVLIFLFSFYNCNSDTASSDRYEDKAKSNERFEVRDHNLLYFRNLRLPFYRTEEVKKDKEFIYRITAQTKDANYPLIKNAIHYDQHSSQAYLLLEANRFFSEDSIKISWIDPDSNNQGEFLLRTDNPDNIFNTAKKLAEYVSIEYDIYYIKGGGRLKIFTKKNDRKQFVTVLNDYIRLISP